MPKILTLANFTLVPFHDVKQLDGRLKLSCTQAGLTKTLRLYNTMSGPDVANAIKGAFSHLVDFDSFAYE